MTALRLNNQSGTSFVELLTSKKEMHYSKENLQSTSRMELQQEDTQDEVAKNSDYVLKQVNNQVYKRLHDDKEDPLLSSPADSRFFD